jgi:hypothetical protein
LLRRLALSWLEDVVGLGLKCPMRREEEEEEAEEEEIVEWLLRADRSLRRRRREREWEFED